MKHINLTKTIKCQLFGNPCEFSLYRKWSDDGFANGTLKIGNKMFGVGGIWIDSNGSPSPYIGNENGDTDFLAKFIGKDEETVIKEIRVLSKKAWIS